jgi:hypothetical protein
MSRRILFVMLTLTACSMLLTTAHAEGELFMLHSSEPVVSHSSDFDDWDGRYTDPGAVLFYDGQFHMFRNGFRNWPAPVQIGYLTSPDGITWTEMSESPVLTTDEVPFAEVAALASSAVVLDDGTWVLYFYTWNKSTPPAGVIGRATAADPLGPWTIDAEPVLVKGSEGSWDSGHIDAPSVIHTESDYIMYYTGSSTPELAGIGMATSSDGIHWTKYDDPATTDAPYAESDPVLVSNRDGYVFHQPRVELINGRYVMVFRHQPIARNGLMGLGLALSDDGISWSIATQEPFWDQDSIPGARGFWFTATTHHDNTLYLYIEGGRGSFTDIYVATAETLSLLQSPLQ